MLTFASYRLDPGNEQLWRGQRLVNLRPKTFAVLRYLAERPQQLVTKHELLDALWGDVHVGEAVLKTHVKEIRQALNDNAESPRFIQTVHRRGYRFVASVACATPSGSTEAAPLAGPSPWLVGRSAELAGLDQLLCAALGRARRVVFVTGEAGIGKTALVNAFLAPLQSRDDLWIAWGQCIEQYGAGAPYLPVLEAFGRLARGPHKAAVIDVFRQTAPTWLAEMPEMHDLRRNGPHETTARGAAPERMLREMAEAIPTLAQLRPLVWLVEDLHWADYSTLDLVSYLARRSDPARLLLIGTYRSVEVRSTSHPLWSIQQGLQLHDQCEEMALSRLTADEVLRYLSDRFVGHRFPEVVARAVQERTAGNPLFVGRVIDTLVKRGILSRAHGGWVLSGELGAIADGVPSSIGAMIEREIERLTALERSVLEVASVAGIEFSTALVAAALGVDAAQVEQLCGQWARRGRFLRIVEDPDQVALRCQFIHALYHQVVYDGIGPARQMRLHRAIAERMETDTDPSPAVLAMHFTRACDPVRAIRYHRGAGDRALRQAAHREAIDHFEAALEQAQILADPERRRVELELQIALGVPLTMTRGYATPEVERVYRRAAELCSELGATAPSFPVMSGLATFFIMRGRYREARALGEQFLALARSESDRSAELEASLVTGTAYVFLSDLPRARYHLEEVLRLYDREQQRSRRFFYQQDACVAATSYLGVVRWHLGEPDQGLALGQESVRFAQAIEDPFSVVTARFFLGFIHLLRREGPEALAEAEVVLASSRDQGFIFLVASGEQLKGAALIESGDLEHGLELLRSGWLAHQACGAEIARTFWRAALAEACLAIGLFEEASSVLSDALRVVRESGELGWEPDLYRIYAELLRRAPNCAPPVLLPLGPEEALLHAIDLATRIGTKGLELRAALALVRLRENAPSSQHVEGRWRCRATDGVLLPVAGLAQPSE